MDRPATAKDLAPHHVGSQREAAKAGVGAAGLALVGCGDDDEPDAGAVAAERAASAAEEAAAAAIAAGEARAAETGAAAAAAADAAAAASAASAAASQAADAADAAAALAAEAAESEDAANAAAAAEAAAAAAADAAAAASAAGDQAAAAVAAAASEAAEAAAQAARDAAAAVEAGTATAAAAQAAIDAAADAAAAAAAAAGEASAAAGEAAATAQETAAAAAETAAAAVAAAQEAAEAAGEAADAAAAAIAAAVAGEAPEFSVPWPLDQVDLDAEIVMTVVGDPGGLDQHRIGSVTNTISHGLVFSGPLVRDPRNNRHVPGIATPEWIDATNIRLDILPAEFHDGSIMTAHDLVFSYNRMGGLAEYHQGGETSDHASGWAAALPGRGAGDWLRNEAVDDRTWAIEIAGPDAGFLTVRMDSTGEVTIMSQADTEARGDTAVDNEPMGSGPMRFVSHTDDEDFVYEHFDRHYRGIDYPLRLPHATHFKTLRALVRPEMQASLAGLEAGEIDIVGGEGIGSTTAAPFVDDPDFTVQFQAGRSFSVHNLMPNLYHETMEDGSPNPFLDIRVRRAANHAINRQSIIDNLFLGVGEQALMVYSGVPGYPSAEQKQEVLFEYDVEKAKALMAEAGYADGFDIKLFWTPDWGGELSPDLALLVAQDLQAVGIRAEPVPVLVGDYATEQYALNAKNLVARPGLYWWWANTVPDIASMWECCTAADGFFSQGPPVDPGMQELYEQQKVEQDPERRLEMTTELLLWHSREASFVFLVEPPDAVITRSDVNWPKGGRLGQLNFDTHWSAQKALA